MKTNVSQTAPGTPVRGSRSSTAREATKETRLKTKLTKTDSLHFTKPYLGSNSLMSREKKSRKLHVKPKFPAVTSATAL